MLIQNFMRWGLRNARAVKAKAMSSKSLSSLFYDFDNVGEFSNLFEHEKMLADSVRVDTYAAAISRHIKPGDVVIDLGTGTGILAILAARQGAKVYAIDHSDFIHVAEQIAKQNGIDNIQFLKMDINSEALTDLIRDSQPEAIYHLAQQCSATARQANAPDPERR